MRMSSCLITNPLAGIDRASHKITRLSGFLRRMLCMDTLLNKKKTGGRCFVIAGEWLLFLRAQVAHRVLWQNQARMGH